MAKIPNNTTNRGMFLELLKEIYKIYYEPVLFRWHDGNPTPLRHSSRLTKQDCRTYHIVVQVRYRQISLYSTEKLELFHPAQLDVFESEEIYHCLE